MVTESTRAGDGGVPSEVVGSSVVGGSQPVVGVAAVSVATVVGAGIVVVDGIGVLLRLAATRAKMPPMIAATITAAAPIQMPCDPSPPFPLT